jgi:peptidoglycan/LPS O-acetylase OafA/YrhL
LPADHVECKFTSLYILDRSSAQRPIVSSLAPSDCGGARLIRWEKTPRAASRRLPGFDLLRGVAIGLVLLRHSWPTLFAGAGIVGVVMFFTLSGYLITGLLQRELSGTGVVSFRRFALRRAIRLLPALTLMLLVFAVVETAVNPLGDRPIVGQTIVAALLYLRDFPLPFATSPAINTFWTLAVEEQFYLLWPVILVTAIRHGFVGRILVIGVGGLVLISSISVGVFATDPATVYILPTTWSSALLIGASAAIYRERLAYSIGWVLRRRALLYITVGVIFAGVALFPGAKNSSWLYIVGGPAIACLTVVLILLLEDWRSLPTRMLEPLRRLGLISYAVYVWNSLVVNWFAPLGALSGVATLAATIMLGTASWFTVERLGGRLKSRLVTSPSDSLNA